MPYLLSVFMQEFFNYCIDTFYIHKHTHLSVYFCQVTRWQEKGQHVNNFHSAKKLKAAQTQTSPYLLKNSETILCYKKICDGKDILLFLLQFCNEIVRALQSF